MAINLDEFTEHIDYGLKANKDFTRFFYRFKIDGKSKRGIFDYTSKNWDKRTRVSKAKSDVLEEKKKFQEVDVGFTDESTLNTVAKFFFEQACDKTAKWTAERQDAYRLYIKNDMGKKKIKNIRLADIDKLKSSMKKQGHSKQTKNGCSPRTIKKILIQVLKPIMQYALDNKIVKEIPKIEAPKQNREKKIVHNAVLTLTSLYTTIMSHYADNSFYRALFLFALYGRRWNEIRTLEWKDINFKNNIYTIRSCNNKIGQDQSYTIPQQIVEALHDIKDNKKGLVFKSPVTSEELHPPKKQLEKIKNISGVEELTMHFFRHIFVSAMGDQGIAGTVLSASLGHINLDTVNNFYRTADHIRASKEANSAIEAILINTSRTN